jgi:formate dehydrogenase subunit gamma
MSELGIPGATRASGPTAMQRAVHTEDVMVGDEIVRHKLSSRVVHWSVAVTFLIALFTGMPIWSPVFGWMSALFGGLTVCRWLHPWSGVAFAVTTLVMFVHWFSQMRFDAADRKFNFIEYLRFSQAEDPEVGKYNAGQKFFFWAATVTMIVLLLTGVVLWWSTSFGQTLRSLSILIHDVAFIGFFMAIVGHIYLGTAAEPGTFRSMTRGTVTKPWARLHHPRWYREVTGERKR